MQIKRILCAVDFSPASDRAAQYALSLAQEAKGRLTMLLLMGMPPIIVMGMMFMNPMFIKPLFTDPIGHFMLVVGIALQTVGYFVIRKIIRIQV